MSHQFHQWRESPREVTVRRRGSRYVASALTYARSLGGERINGYGTDGLGALQNLLRRWTELTETDLNELPRMRVVPDGSRATDDVSGDTISAEFDATLIGPGMRSQERMMVRAMRDGRFQLGVLRWRPRSTLVTGRRVDFERRDFIQIGELPLSQSMIRSLWNSRHYARHRALRMLARRAAIRLSVGRDRYLPFAKTEVWTREAATLVLVCAADDSPWGTALQVRFGYDRMVEICRPSYRVIPRRSETDRASIVPSLSAWTVHGRHTLDLRALKKRKPHERISALRAAFWSTVNPALEDPFVYIDHPLIAAKPAELPAPLAAGIEEALTDLVVTHGPYEHEGVWLEYVVEFHPEARVFLQKFSEDCPELREKFKRTLETLVAEANLPPMGRFTPRDHHGPYLRLSEWCQTTETCYLRILPDVSAHRRLLAHRRIAARAGRIDGAKTSFG